MENSANQTPQKKSPVTLILIVLLVLLTALGAYLGYTNNELQKQLANCGAMKDTVTNEKNEVVADLEKMSAQYDSLALNSDSLSTELLAEREKVQKLLTQAKNNKWSIYKLKKEASTLREIMKGYVRTIDSLNTMNVELKAENAEVSRRLNEEKTISNKLKEKNEQLDAKVKLGAKLKALDMIAYGQRVKRNGVHRETSRASKAQKVKCCFTVDKNEVIEPGNKIIYLRVIAPSGKVLAEKTDSSQMFEFKGNKGLFSVKKDIKYDNRELDICMYYDVKNTLEKGQYLVEAYIDGLEIGTTSFELK